MRGLAALGIVILVSSCAKPMSSTENRPAQDSKVATWSEVLDSIRAGNVAEVTLGGGEAHFSAYTQSVGPVLILDFIPENLEAFIHANAPNAGRIQILSGLFYPGVKEKK